MSSRELVFAAAGASGPANYIESCFSTYLYTGNGSTQTITNGIDLAGEGGLVWIKGRSGATDHALYDTTRGATFDLVSNSSAAQTTQSTGLTAFNGNGFSIGALAKLNTSAATYASWTFREQPKFFDVVTYTGNGSNPREISHSLGSTPGMIIIKCTSDQYTPWSVYHRSLSSGVLPLASSWVLYLNTTDAQGYNSAIWNSTLPTSTSFTIGDGSVNANGRTYVAYLFAHDAGGFGAAGTDNVISCGSLSASTTTEVNLGYEPQYVLIKNATDGGPWYVSDVMRGMPNTDWWFLQPAASDAESNTGAGTVIPTATGFTFKGANLGYTSGQNIIYMAIRRPMKVPTDATTVFKPQTYTGTSAVANITGFGFPPDLSMIAKRSGFSLGTGFWDRLRGVNRSLYSATTNSEYSSTDALTAFGQNGITLGVDSGNYNTNQNTEPYISWNFRRATGFFDVVCYTGTGTYGATNHNLGVTPELVLYKSRSATAGWSVIKTVSSTQYYAATLNDASAASLFTDPSTASLYTSTQMAKYQDTSGSTYVAYLFASVAGVSKVGSYTGNGSSQTINCGFTGGARFVMVKATSTTGDWVVVDTARGIVTGNDPFLQLNSTAAEVTGEDILDPDSSGFVVNQTTESINASGVSYIFLAVA